MTETNTNETSTNLDFGQALRLLKAGKRVARAGWNGAGMWVCLMPAVVIPEGVVNGRTKQFVPTGDLNCQPYLAMWTAKREWQPGWLASQADMLANDWEIVP